MSSAVTVLGKGGWWGEACTKWYYSVHGSQRDPSIHKLQTPQGCRFACAKALRNEETFVGPWLRLPPRYTYKPVCKTGDAPNAKPWRSQVVVGDENPDAPKNRSLAHDAEQAP